MKKKKVLFLGATGRVGPGILEEYQSKYKQDYDFILGSRKKLTIKNYETVKIDFSSITSLKKAMKNIDRDSAITMKIAKETVATPYVVPMRRSPPT